MLYEIYRALTSASAPILDRLLEKRLLNGKEDADRVTEKRGITSIPRPAGKLVWLHAASVGESLSALPLLEELQRRLPGRHFLVTTGTLTSAKLMHERLPQGMQHQFMPLDHPQWVKKFLDHWKPDAVLWMESELWPNMLHEIPARRIPAILLNARMRPQSQAKWKLARGLSKKMLGTFRLVLAGARSYATSFKKLGATNVKYIGNLKFGAPALPVPQDKLSELQQSIGSRPVISFLSTHSGEEEIAAKTFMRLKQDFPDLLMIIAPRKVTRGQEIADLLDQKMLKTALRSQSQEVTDATDVYIADTIGEMGLWYSLSPIVVIGGSFIVFGGQNPLEALHFNCAVLYGPHMYNFPEICLAIEENNAAIAIPNTDVLFSTIRHLLNTPAALVERQQASQALASQSNHVIAAYADEIMAQLAGQL